MFVGRRRRVQGVEEIGLEREVVLRLRRVIGIKG